MANLVIFVGRLGADAEMRFLQNGGAVTNCNLATSERWKDKQTGEQMEKTEWHRIVFFNIGNYKLAEIAGEHLKKGMQVYIQGRLQTRKWKDQAGNDRYTTEIVAENMQTLGSKSDNQNQQNNGYQQPPHYQQSQPPANPQGANAYREATQKPRLTNPPPPQQQQHYQPPPPPDDYDGYYQPPNF